jgi:hypothetical protein
MSAANALIAAAVVVWIMVRQFTARSWSGNPRRYVVLPLVLAVVALREPGLVDAGHRAASVALLVGGVALEAVLATAWAFTTRVWREPDGTVWSKGTPAALGVWAVMIAARIGLYALGAALGVHTGEAAILLTVAALLLVRNAVVGWRARALEPAYRVPAAV